MAIPKFYESTDASAPALTGENGSLIAVLDAILVDGYGAKAAAGWTKPYSGTNLAVYQSATGRLLHVQDDGARISAAFARIRGATSATGAEVADLVGAHPSTGNATWGKTAAANTTERAWKAAATADQIWFFQSTGQTIDGYGVWHPWFAGYFMPSIPGDNGNFMVIGYHGTATVTNVNFSTAIQHAFTATATASVNAPGGLARNFDDTSSSVDAGYLSSSAEGQGSAGTTVPGFASVVPHPSPSQGGLPASPVFVYETGGVRYLRGQLPGIYMPLVKISTHTAGAMPAEPWEPLSLDIGYGTRTYRFVPTNVFYSIDTGGAVNEGSKGGWLFDIDSDWSAP